MPDARPDAQGVPAWMKEAGIQKGQWLMLTKRQLKSQQRPDKPLKVRVWATGMLHTNGYQGQLAVTMTKGKKRPLTPADIIRELYNVSLEYFAAGNIEATPEQLASLAETKETIRRALSDLEEDGICARTDAKGRPLSDLTPDQLRRLPSGSTKMFFWLTPKDASKPSIEEQWREHIEAQSSLKTPEVDKNCGSTISISLILKTFQVGQFSKKQLSDSSLSAAITHAYEVARQAFVKQFEVDTACLPKEVVTPRPPKVDTPVGALERKDERIENHHHRDHPEGEIADLMMMTEEQFHEAVCDQFAAAGKPLPGVKLTKPVFAALNGDKREFVAYLTPAKLAPVRSAGILPDLLQDFRDAQKQASRRKAEQREELSRTSEADSRRAAELEANARRVLENPEEHTANEIEWAQEVLKTPSVA